MAKQQIPHDPSDDELESLAEDLFGVRLNAQQGDLEPFDVGAFDLEDDEPSALPPDEASGSDLAEKSLAAAPVQAAPLLRAADDDDFGGSLLDDEFEAPVSAPSVKAPQPAAAATDSGSDALGDLETNADLNEEDEEEEEIIPDALGPEEDEYWDALDGFEWDEDSDDKKSSAMRKEYVEATETFEDLSIESAEKTDEFLDDADFGAGLDEQEPAPSPVAAAPDSQDEGEPKGRRRRRGGRRRGRRGESQEREPSAEKAETRAEPKPRTPQRDESEAASPEEDDDLLEADDVIEPGSEESDDGFGAGLEVDVPRQKAEADETKKRRRRRGGRRRGKRKSTDAAQPDAAQSETAQPAAAQHDDGIGSDASADGDGEDAELDAADRAADKYRSVPTWEEAINYLIRPAPRSSGGGNSGSGSRRGRRGSRRRS